MKHSIIDEVGAPPIMVNLDHPCREIDICEAESLKDYNALMGQGYIKLERIRELVAAVPELLEACELLVAALALNPAGRRGMLQKKQQMIDSSFAAGIAAIAKAKGPKTNDVDVDPASDDDSIQERIEIDDDFAEEVQNDRNNEPEP